MTKEYYNLSTFTLKICHKKMYEEEPRPSAISMAAASIFLWLNQFIESSDQFSRSKAKFIKTLDQFIIHRLIFLMNHQIT